MRRRKFLKKLFTALLIALPILAVAAPNTCDISDYGAAEGNQFINTEAIQKAIDDCADKGGGGVIVPTGTFFTGTIHLKSNINLYLQAGAVLKGSPNIDDYESYKAPNFPDSTHYGMLYTDQAHNVSITGSGTINGNEEAFFNFDKAKNIQWGGTRNTRQGKKFRVPSEGIGDGPVLPKERPRQMVIFSRSSNVTIRDVQLNKSPFWTLHIADSDGVNISGVQVHASRLTPNSDGIDITSSRNVIITNCDVRTGDDAIAITGYAYHFELPGFHNVRHVSENIVISNCNLQSSSSGIRVGFIDQNTVRNVLVTNVNITDTNRGIGIFLRGPGSLENITFSQMNIETRYFTGDWWGNGEPIHISAVRGEEDVELGMLQNVNFRDITATGENGILLYGTQERKIHDVTFENIDFTLVSSPIADVAGGNIDLRAVLDADSALFKSDIAGFYGRYVQDISIENSSFKWSDVTKPYFRRTIYFNHFEDVRLHNIDLQPSPANTDLRPVKIENGIGFESTINKEKIQR